MPPATPRAGRNKAEALGKLTRRLDVCKLSPNLHRVSVRVAIRSTAEARVSIKGDYKGFFQTFQKGPYKAFYVGLKRVPSGLLSGSL